MAEVDLNGVIRQAQAETIIVIGKSFAAQASRQAIMADKQFDELGTAESVANRYATTGMPNAATG